MVKNGLLRIVFGGTVGIVLIEVLDASWIAFSGVGLVLLLGMLLTLGLPFFVMSAFVRTILDTLAVSLVVLGVGGVDTPLSLLFFVAAFGVVWIRSTLLAAIASGGVIVAYLVCGASTGTLNLTDIPLYVAILAAFCAVSWATAGEIEDIDSERRRLADALDAERSYSVSVSGLATNFGSVLEVLDLRGILGWTSKTALDMTGAKFSHVVLLDNNRHATDMSGDASVMPTWWHPAVQEIVLKASRSDEPIVEQERSVHDLGGLAAVPLHVEGSEHNGTLLVGGGRFGEKEVRVLKLVARQAASSLGRVSEAPGGRDPVSGLPNRVSLYRALQDELTLSGRVTLVSLCVNGMWNPVLDSSMSSGEEFLKRLAKDLGERHRTYRYSSDEFYILSRGSNARRAERVSAWVRDLVHDLCENTPLEPRIATSYTVSEAGEGAGQLLLRAERSLAEAKGMSAPGSYSAVVEQTDGRSAGNIISALLKAASIRDQALAVHLSSVRRLALVVGEEMGLDEAELQVLSNGALLHDVGKIGVPDGILKKPGKLTDAEFDVIKSHTIMGASVLAQVPELVEVVPVVRHHHERYDGRGYPDGIAGKDIPFASRIVFVVDAYDSMVQDRAYRRGLPHKEALNEIARNAGTQFDPDVAKTFLSIMQYDGEISDGRWGLSAI